MSKAHDRRLDAIGEAILDMKFKAFEEATRIMEQQMDKGAFTQLRERLLETVQVRFPKDGHKDHVAFVQWSVECVESVSAEMAVLYRAKLREKGIHV